MKQDGRKCIALPIVRMKDSEKRNERQKSNAFHSRQS